MSEEINTTPRQYRFNPLGEGIAVASVIFLAIFFVSYFIYFRALEAQKEEIKESLIRAGGVIESFLDIDLHRTFRTPESENTPEYQDQIAPLWRVLNAGVQIAFVYTVIMDDDGKVYFILDATPDGDEDGDGVEDSVAVMEEYPPEDVAEELREALEEQKFTSSREPYTDAWGTFVSGYVPLFDSDGNFEAILGLDIDYSNYDARLQPIKRATTRAMVAGFFISYMIGSIVWFLRQFAAQLNTSRMRFFSGAEQPTEHSSDAPSKPAAS